MNSNNRIELKGKPRPLKLRGPLWIFATVLLVSCGSAHASDVLYIESSSADAVAREQLKSAADFLGLSVTAHAAAGRRDPTLLQLLQSPDLVALVINADALPFLDMKAVFASLKRRPDSIPLMVSDVSERTDPDSLKDWSGGAASGAAKLEISRQREWYRVEPGNDVTRQLGGSQLLIPAGQVDYLVLDRAAENLLLLTAGKNAAEQPALVRIRFQSRSVFIAAESHVVNPPATPDPYRQQTLFASIAAPILFLDYAGGDRVWHSPASYANLTIDDPWLREPYGHVNYDELLRQAQAHDFHATIAFIPWNFDRSQPEVVSLFRQNPDKLSICIHGNNHVHQEFGPLPSHPLSEQEWNMRQSLARMEEFRALTHIPFDPVMVFPHSIAPEATFSELRKAQYLGTVNSLNVPSDATTPDGFDFALRTSTLHFGDLPSLRRYSAETDIPPAQLAIDAFLGNPLLFYVHESFFSSGMDAFDKIADFVNTLQPGIQWDSLGSVIQHLYLEKRLYDGRYELRSFSPKIQVTNHHHRDVEYLLEKDEDFSHGLTVLLGDDPVSFERMGDQLRVGFRVEKGTTKQFSIIYGDHLEISNVGTAKNSWRTNSIRMLSDFRDNVVSRTLPGRKFIKSYANNGLRWNLFFTFFCGLLLVLFLARYLLRRRKLTRVSDAHSVVRQAG